MESKSSGKVTEKEVTEWVRKYSQGYTYKEIAEEYGRHPKTVGRYVREATTDVVEEDNVVDVVEEETEKELNRNYFSEDQLARLQGICHIEGYENPIQALDVLLDRDRVLRKALKNPEDMDKIIDYVQYVLNEGLHLDHVARLQYNLINAYNKIEALEDFLDSRGVEVVYLPDEDTYLLRPKHISE